MGKPSKLNERRQGRVLYDRDKMPEGLDPEIWHLTLFFDQIAESYTCGIPGRPIVYMELSTRINASHIREKFTHWSGIVEDMIQRFWDHELDPGKNQYAINEFCSAGTFSYLLKWVVDSRARQLLIETGDRVRQSDHEAQESRRDERDSKAAEIINKKYSEDELAEKRKSFYERWQGANK